VVVSYDYRRGAKVPIPPAIRSAIAALEGEIPSQTNTDQPSAPVTDSPSER